MGMRNSLKDFWVHGKSWLSVPVEPKAKRSSRARRAALVTGSTVSLAPAADWATVLHFGSGEWTASGKAPSAPVPSPRAPGVVGRVFASRSSAPEEPAFRTVFQPIIELSSGYVTGREALTRFDDGVAPHQRLAEEAARGDGLELEILLARASVQAAANFDNDEWLALNVSVSLMRAGQALLGIVDRARRPVVLEVDAQMLIGAGTVADVLPLLSDIPPGTSIALTGVDPSYEGLTLVRELRPAFVKLDRGWVRAVQTDPARLALVRALGALTDQMGAQLIAEGVETEAELEALRDVGVRYGQGYLLGRPRASVNV
jgi:EAL domain-containing protein (putative c-di-GMP-specific phosphodiesterase class I)